MENVVEPGEDGAGEAVTPPKPAHTAEPPENRCH